MKETNENKENFKFNFNCLEILFRNMFLKEASFKLMSVMIITKKFDVLCFNEDFSSKFHILILVIISGNIEMLFDT
jgi:hypothetical protein